MEVQLSPRVLCHCWPGQAVLASTGSPGVSQGSSGPISVQMVQRGRRERMIFPSARAVQLHPWVLQVGVSVSMPRTMPKAVLRETDNLEHGVVMAPAAPWSPRRCSAVFIRGKLRLGHDS